MMLSVCFNPKPVLYKHSLIVWWLKIGTVWVCEINTMAETIRNKIKHCHTCAICKKIAFKHGFKTNTARGEAKCCIRVSWSHPWYYFFFCIALAVLILNIQHCSSDWKIIISLQGQLNGLLKFWQACKKPSPPL